MSTYNLSTFVHCKLSEPKSHIYVIGRWNTIFQANDTIVKEVFDASALPNNDFPALFIFIFLT